MPHRLVTRVALVFSLSFPLACASIPRSTIPTCGPDGVPVRDLEAASLRYQGTFTVAGAMMPATSSLTVTPHPAGGWAVAEHAQLPRGAAVDSVRLDAHSLTPRERIIHQGATQITLRFAEHQATGTITTGARTRPISAEVCGSLFGDGAGAFLLIGRLPLHAGYRASLRHFDIKALRTTARQITVIGNGQTSVPAGRFDTWTIEISDEGSSAPTMVWIDKVSLKPVRFSAPQGPVTIAMELVG
jgi:hypothetical protein